MLLNYNPLYYVIISISQCIQQSIRPMHIYADFVKIRRNDRLNWFRNIRLFSYVSFNMILLNKKKSFLLNSILKIYHSVVSLVNIKSTLTK